MGLQAKIFAGRYRVRRTVSTSMAEVYEAYDMEADRTVALKLLSSAQFEHDVVAEVFRRETRALRELKHPNIVELLDSGIDAETGYPYLVLEWIPHDLAFVIDRRPFPGWDEFYESAGRAILEAIAFSHARQIAHRDIKLKNVLVEADAHPKLADFGIAKLRTDIAPGVTLREFVTRPYAPPEPDEGMHAFARDVYGFGVLALRCLLPKELLTYDDVYEGLEAVDVPPEIFPVLGDALDRDPSRRPMNGEVLLDRIERVQRTRQKAWQVRPCVMLVLTKKATDALRRQSPGKSELELQSIVKSDLETFAIEPYKANQEGTHFQIIGGRCWYHVTVAPEETHLVVLNAGGDDELKLERRRDNAAAPELDFRFGAVRDAAAAKNAVFAFVDAVATHRREAEERQKAAADDALLGTWDRVLRAKEELERRRETPIAFDGVERDGNRLRLRPTVEVDDAYVGQFRQIRTGDVIHVQGEIESVAPEEVVLYVTAEYGGVPRRGTLVIDVAQSKRALERQRKALDDVRFNRAVRSDLRQLLVSPSNAADPLPVELSGFVQELDDSKKDAVRAALGASDFLLVEGPPGTGKTTFITELILQTLRRNPESRILLASQTHVALDNALEGVRRADATLRMVRVGRPSDAKISASVSDLLLDNQMPQWRKASLARADEYLRARAESLGMSLDHLFIARRLSEVHRIRVRTAELDAEMAEIQRRLDEWHRQRPEDLISVAEGTVPVEISELQDSEASIKKELKDLRRSEDEATEELLRRDPDLKDILADDASDLAGWEAAFRPASTTSAHLDRLIAIRSEWDLRFGKGREFQSALIASAQVVAGTCVGLAAIRGIQDTTFDLCIIDEASKANATEALVPMAMARRWILVGDERQLPPFVEDELTSRDFQAAHDIHPDDLRLTVFAQLSAHLPPACMRSLLVQHRMRPAIGTLISQCFYEGRLQNGDVRGAGESVNVFPRPVTWYSTAVLSDRIERSHHATFTNTAESRIIAGLLREVDRAAGTAQRRLRVAVLAAYAGQRADIRRRIDAAERLQWLDIECNTVDAFQGREAHIAIYSVTRSNPKGNLGFLRDLRRLNVALSRARFGLAIVGDHAFARNAEGENPFRRVVEFIEQHPEAGTVEIVR